VFHEGERRGRLGGRSAAGGDENKPQERPSHEDSFRRKSRIFK
jgi:hypothetical protein